MNTSIFAKNQRKLEVQKTLSNFRGGVDLVQTFEENQNHALPHPHKSSESGPSKIYLGPFQVPVYLTVASVRWGLLYMIKATPKPTYTLTIFLLPQVQGESNQLVIFSHWATWPEHISG